MWTEALPIIGWSFVAMLAALPAGLFAMQLFISPMDIVTLVWNSMTAGVLFFIAHLLIPMIFDLMEPLPYWMTALAPGAFLLFLYLFIWGVMYTVQVRRDTDNLLPQKKQP